MEQTKTPSKQYYADMYTLWDLVKNKCIEPKIATILATRMADYFQEPMIYLW